MEYQTKIKTIQETIKDIKYDLDSIKGKQDRTIGEMKSSLTSLSREKPRHTERGYDSSINKTINSYNKDQYSSTYGMYKPGFSGTNYYQSTLNDPQITPHLKSNSPQKEAIDQQSQMYYSYNQNINFNPGVSSNQNTIEQSGFYKPQFSSNLSTRSQNNQIDNKYYYNYQSDTENKGDLSSFRKAPENTYSPYLSDSSSIYRNSRSKSFRSTNRNQEKYKNKLNFNYGNIKSRSNSRNNHIQVGSIFQGEMNNKSKVEEDIGDLRKEIERLKYDNFILKEQVKKQGSSGANSSNIKRIDPNALENDYPYTRNDPYSLYTPTLNSSNKMNFSYHENSSFETKCVKMVEKLQEVLNTKTVTDTYNKVLEKLHSDKKLQKLEELYCKLTDIYTNIHGKNSLAKLVSGSNKVATVVKEENHYKVSTVKNTDDYNVYEKKLNTTFHDKSRSKSNRDRIGRHKEEAEIVPTLPSNYYVYEIKGIWRWIKRLVQRSYFSGKEVNQEGLPNEGDHQEGIALLSSIKKEYKLKNLSEVKKFIINILSKTEKQRSRVDKIKQILNTNPIKSRSVSRSRSKLD
mmetsp:Transcript_16365/g.17010  ORF Transcript_16365/g.17010 Transcript_16365/m.17010 type:complete len:572 (+) Transcript_16365:13-1728(+)